MEQLRFAAESIQSFSAASVGQALSGMASKLQSLLPEMLSGIKHAKEMIPADSQAVKLPQDQRKFLELLNRVSFAEIRHLRAYVPEGFTGNLLTYSAILNVGAALSARMQDEVLQPYNVLLGTLISTADASKLNDDKALAYARHSEVREKCISGIGDFFHSGRMDSVSTVGAVMPNNAGWGQMLNQMSQMSASLGSISKDGIMHSVQVTDDYLNIIHQKLTSGQLANVTPETANALARGALELARDVEFYSVVHFRALALEASVGRTIELISKVMAER